MKDSRCNVFWDASKCKENDCKGCPARLVENKYREHDAEIRAKAITEFAEAMKKKYPIAECGFGLMNDRLHENIDEIAKRLKGE